MVDCEALVPEWCDCQSRHYDERAGCPTCHGSGKVYPAELVERIATALNRVMAHGPAANWHLQGAVAVLDALNGEMS